MTSTSSRDRILLGVIEFKEAKRLRSILDDQGIKLELVSNPSTCTTGGCTITVEAYAAETDLPKIQKFLGEERTRLFSGLEFDQALTEEVFDTEKASARCPACGTEFSTQSSECPDCGLVFINN